MEHVTTSKSTRNRLVGSNVEPPTRPIDLPLTLAKLRALSAGGAHPKPDARSTHQQFREWASRSW